MQISVYDPDDELFAYLMVTIAQRRGHTAAHVRSVSKLRQPDAGSSMPRAVIVGLHEIDDAALALVLQTREADPDVLLYLVAEDARPHQRILALEAGASDVLQKPVLPREVLLRAEHMIPERERNHRPEGALRVGDITVDLDRVHAVKAGHQLNLTRMELRLLYCLLEHQGRVAPTERLLSFGWESDEPSSSTLKTHISHLRQKLAEAGGLTVQIRSRQMLGYTLEVASAEEAGAEAATAPSALRAV